MGRLRFPRVQATPGMPSRARCIVTFARDDHLAAGLLAKQLVGEPITPNLVLGLVAVFAGIWIATS
jgi:hypothetical protein